MIEDCRVICSSIETTAAKRLGLAAETARPIPRAVIYNQQRQEAKDRYRNGCQPLSILVAHGCSSNSQRNKTPWDRKSWAARRKNQSRFVRNDTPSVRRLIVKALRYRFSEVAWKFIRPRKRRLLPEGTHQDSRTSGTCRRQVVPGGCSNSKRWAPPPPWS